MRLEVYLGIHYGEIVLQTYLQSKRGASQHVTGLNEYRTENNGRFVPSENLGYKIMVFALGVARSGAAPVIQSLSCDTRNNSALAYVTPFSLCVLYFCNLYRPKEKCLTRMENKLRQELT